MVEKQASSEIAGKSMNKSEIAERAAREIYDHGADLTINNIAAIVERAIAESQSPDEELTGTYKCPVCDSDVPHSHEIRLDYAVANLLKALDRQDRWLLSLKTFAEARGEEYPYVEPVRASVRGAIADLKAASRVKGNENV